MDKRSSLSEQQREAAVALFEIGWGSRAVATRLGVGRKALLRLHDRWRVRGDTALVTKPGKRLYSFELKLSAVQRYISGESRVALAKELDLSSPHLIAVWAGQYRAEGEEGLRPKPKGRGRTQIPQRSRNRSCSGCAERMNAFAQRWPSWEK
jgi:transposase-like protein